MPLTDYLRPPISNGNPVEQALIRGWWHEEQGAKGRLVWEYYLGDCYLDAMWFPDAAATGEEQPGTGAPKRFPLAGAGVVLCEAKQRLTPELIGQALVYGVFARRGGAEVRSTVIFAESGGGPSRRRPARRRYFRRTNDTAQPAARGPLLRAVLGDRSRAGLLLQPTWRYVLVCRERASRRSAVALQGA